MAENLTFWSAEHLASLSALQGKEAEQMTLEGGSCIPIWTLWENINRNVSGGNGTGYSISKAYTVTASDIHAVAVNQTVRYLTPLECERLQGFPDNYTQIEWRGKPKERCPDSHRYKAIGNSMAVPVMRWIGQRIAIIEGCV